jgi:hypothetical protein
VVALDHETVQAMTSHGVAVADASQHAAQLGLMTHQSVRREYDHLRTLVSNKAAKIQAVHWQQELAQHILCMIAQPQTPLPAYGTEACGDGFCAFTISVLYLTVTGKLVFAQADPRFTARNMFMCFTRGTSRILD